MRTKFLISSDNTTRNGYLKKQIIHYYMMYGDATIADICKEMNLSIPTITKLIVELLEDGYILELGKQETSGGRKPSIYGLNPSSGYFMGVDVLKDHLKLVIIDFKGNVIRLNDNQPYTLEDSMEAVDRMCDEINKFISNSPISKDQLLSIGVNISGRVNPFMGCSYSVFNLKDKPLCKVLEEKLEKKVFLDNDSRAMAYGEYIQGVVKEEKNILFVNICWGLGISIIIDGKVYYGKSGLSGEFGHFSLFDNEILCHCGKKGCLETEASGSALCRILVERYKQGSSTILADKIDSQDEISLEDLITAIRKGDVLTIDTLENIGINIGKGIAGLINIFNPDLVILGGPLSQIGDYLIFPVKSAIQKYSLNLVSQDTKVEVSQLQEKAGVLGAALLSRSKTVGIL